MNRHSREARVYHDAFCRATMQPKIPDNKITSSLGQSIQCSKSLFNKYSAHDNAMLVIYPGLNATAKWIDSQGETSERWEHQGALIQRIDDTNKNNTTDPHLIFHNESNWHSWRVVSAAAQITCVMSANRSQGWWEAIAVPLPDDERYYHYSTGALTNVANYKSFADATYTQFEPSRFWFDCGGLCECGGRDAWVANDSYCCGAIEHLVKRQFQLQTFNRDHNFIPLPDRMKIKTRNLPVGDPTLHEGPDNYNPNIQPINGDFVSPNGIQSNVTSTENADKEMMCAIKKTIDPSYFVWLVKFHCTSDIHLLIHTISNQEWVAKCGTVERRLHTNAFNVFQNKIKAQPMNRVNHHGNEDIVEHRGTDLVDPDATDYARLAGKRKSDAGDDNDRGEKFSKALDTTSKIIGTANAVSQLAEALNVP